MLHQSKISSSQKEKLFFIDPFMQRLCQELSKIINKSLSLTPSLYELVQNIHTPPKEEWGHYSLPCFFLNQTGKTSKGQNPAILATQIAKGATPSPVFEKASATGPYVNFFVKKSFIQKYLLDFIQKGFPPPLKKTEPWLIEYSQPNTHKELHIGHLRNLFFGLSLTTLLKKRGWPVITCTYPGDMGTHINKCLWYLTYHNKTPVPQKNKGEWLGALYAKACQKYDQTPEQERAEQIKNIAQQLQEKKGPSYKLWQETRLWSKELMDQLYQWAGAKFDYWYWESEIDTPSVKWVKELYQQKLLELSKGAIGLDLNPQLGFCLLLKSDGQGLYATKDLYLMAQKFKDHKPAQNIYIVDQRQETHFQQIFKVMEHLNHKDWANKSTHLKYNFVELKEGVISSRTGNIVPAQALIHKMTKYIEEVFLKKYQGQWTEQKITHTSKMIAQGALQFGMNDQDLNKKIVFDMKEWLKLDGRSGPYIQYAYARACTLLNKFPSQELKNIKPLITTPEEWGLILHISWFSLLMEKSAWQMKTAPICHYLFELAQKFSRFYQNCPIGKANNEDQKNFRLFLTQVTKKTLKEGLSTLSIPTPTQM